MDQVHLFNTDDASGNHWRVALQPQPQPGLAPGVDMQQLTEARRARERQRERQRELQLQRQLDERVAEHRGWRAMQPPTAERERQRERRRQEAEDAELARLLARQEIEDREFALRLQAEQP